MFGTIRLADAIVWAPKRDGGGTRSRSEGRSVDDGVVEDEAFVGANFDVRDVTTFRSICELSTEDGKRDQSY